MRTPAVVEPGPFRLSFAGMSRVGQPLVAAARTILERALALPSLNSIYAEASARDGRGTFCDRALAAMQVSAQVTSEDLERIPTSGPLIAISNHPFGGLDGLILTALLQRVRPDVKLLANYLLRCMPELHETAFFVDPFGGRAAAARNQSAIRSAVRWVLNGGVLGVFPAGEVSHYRWASGCVTDPPWSDAVARIVHRTKADLLPILFDGRNTRVFQLAGLLHPRLRTVLLPRQLLNQRGRSVRVEVGHPILYGRLAKVFSLPADSKHFADADAARMTDYLRMRTYILRGRIPCDSRAARKRVNRASLTARDPSVVAAEPTDSLTREIAALPGDRCLAEGGSLQVFYASATEAPSILREIGRLRELTFRAAGEGTGRETDLDRFDEHYLHLFAWHQEGRQIVGAYRMGATDLILARFGVRGLYTNTLFDFKPRLLEQISPGLELGRSFVIAEYQKDYAPLMLLWKGIGRFVSRHPRYRHLFGAVSISDEYHTMTKQLLMAFLRANCFDAELSELVRPRNPPPRSRFRDVDEKLMAAQVGEMANVDELVEEIEHGRKGVPVLLRQYLKLNAKVLGFNIDPDFGDVLDGLLLADLVTVNRAILDRYLGRQDAAALLAYHRAGSAALSPA